MSRSRRKQKEPKCCCGRLLTRYKDHSHVRSECRVLFYVAESNDKFLKFREQRSLPLTEED